MIEVIRDIDSEGYAPAEVWKIDGSRTVEQSVFTRSYLGECVKSAAMTTAAGSCDRDELNKRERAGFLVLERWREAMVATDTRPSLPDYPSLCRIRIEGERVLLKRFSESYPEIGRLPTGERFNPFN